MLTAHKAQMTYWYGALRMTSHMAPSSRATHSMDDAFVSLLAPYTPPALEAPNTTCNCRSSCLVPWQLPNSQHLTQYLMIEPPYVPHPTMPHDWPTVGTCPLCSHCPCIYHDLHLTFQHLVNYWHYLLILHLLLSLSTRFSSSLCLFPLNDSCCGPNRPSTAQFSPGLLSDGPWCGDKAGHVRGTAGCGGTRQVTVNLLVKATRNE